MSGEFAKRVSATGAEAGAGREGGPPALLVIGEVVTDVIARHTAPPVRGTDTAARIRILPGGAGANVACWAARRGTADVRLLARVGAADAGWHEERLRAAGVRPVLVVDEAAPTSTVIALVDAAAERTFLADGGAAARSGPADWSPSLLAGAGHLHLSGYLFFSGGGHALARLAARAARARGVPVSADPASAGFIDALGTDRLMAEYEAVDVLLPNADEARLLTGRSDPADAAAALGRRVPLVVVTLGADGALVAESGAPPVHVTAPTVRPVDSTGAGDAFTGTFLAARLAGGDAVAAAAEGCRAGAEAVVLTGGRPVPPAGGRRAPDAGHSPAQDGASTFTESGLPFGST
ncbi:PfkB family carbohydrate kinase [Streptomyces amakusaensis]|uniref:Carbohydrate kinase family protein n=1 Tax=Streptomyces amakusaensis TaxID=67271 RepID=A0ABW0ACX0_9ACTN